MRHDVNRLQSGWSHYESIVQKCVETVEESEKTNTVQVNKILRSLKNMKDEIHRLHENRSLSEVRPEPPPSPEFRRVKLYGGACLVRHISGTITEFLPSFRNFDEKNYVSEALQYFHEQLPYQPGSSFYRTDTAIIGP